MNYLPLVDSQTEIKKITNFLKKVFSTQKVQKAVIGVSGGIDSALSLHLLSLSLSKENILVFHLPFYSEEFDIKKALAKSTKIPEKNFRSISIKDIVEKVAKVQKITVNSSSQDEKIRLGNIMARVRMMILFDEAKKNHALVCGTENKTENLLGYFTRFGDAASDIEPISHLYKTQVRELSKFLNIPAKIINKQPSAGLWAGQTDENEFGFSYEEADQVLYLYFEKKYSFNKIKSLGLLNCEKIISFAKKNSFKHKTPYVREAIN